MGLPVPTNHVYNQVVLVAPILILALVISPPILIMGLGAIPSEKTAVMVTISLSTTILSVSVSERITVGGVVSELVAET